MPDLVQCAVCGGVVPGAPRRQGSFDVRTIEDHTSEISGFPCHGTHYVFHKPADLDNPSPPRLCRTCRGTITAANAADHRRNCH